jgi:hypothetical protein
MFNNILIFIISLLISSCKNHHSEEIVSKNLGIKNFFSEETEAYALDLSDSTKLIFSGDKAFDTSFILVIEKVDTLIKAKFLYYPPTYYKNWKTWENHGMFLYKGINFEIPYSKWKSLETRLEEWFTWAKKRLNNRDGILHPFKSKIYFKNFLITNEEYEFNGLYGLIFQGLINPLLIRYPTVNGYIP